MPLEDVPNLGVGITSFPSDVNCPGRETASVGGNAISTTTARNLLTQSSSTGQQQMSPKSRQEPTDGRKKMTAEERRRSWKKKRNGRKFPRRRPKNHNQRQKWEGERTPTQSLPLELEQEKKAQFVQKLMKFGKPHAPYNTTQFLMEDHNVRDPEFEQVNRLIRRQESECADESTRGEGGSDMDDFYSSPDEQDFQQKQFDEVYDYVHAERLNSMSKSDLIQELLVLEEKTEDLEKKLRETKAAYNELKSRNHISTSSSSSSQEVSSSNDSEELSALRAQVARLTQENLQLRRQCSLRSRGGSTVVDADTSQSVVSSMEPSRPSTSTE